MSRTIHSAVQDWAHRVLALSLVFLCVEGTILALHGELHAAAFTAWAGSWGTAYSAGQVLFRATTLLILAIASDIALRAGVVSVAVEAQLTVACLVSAVVAVRFPSWMCFGAVMSGAAASLVVAACVAWLYVRRGVRVVLSGLLLNPLVAVLVSFALAHGAGMRGTVRTPSIDAAMTIARVDGWWQASRGSALSYGSLIAPLALVLSSLYFARTSVGRETVLVGLNERACRAQGIPTRRRVVQALLLSAAVAALGSLTLVFGGKGYFEEGMGTGLGFSGLAVAMMARGNSTRMLVYALCVATMEQAALACHAYLPRDGATVLLAIFLVAMCAADSIRTRRSLVGCP